MYLDSDGQFLESILANGHRREHRLQFVNGLRFLAVAFMLDAANCSCGKGYTMTEASAWRVYPAGGLNCNGGDGGCGGNLQLGDGDCDSDSDCAGDLRCGENNCVANWGHSSPEWDGNGASWQAHDDCCSNNYGVYM